MVRIPTVVALTFATFITSAAYAAPANTAATAIGQIAGEIGQTLTLSSAKQMVAAKLDADGQRQLRPGHAEFDGEGNVMVEILSVQGLPVSHVLVHANNGMITDAGTGKKSRG